MTVAVEAGSAQPGAPARARGAFKAEEGADQTHGPALAAQGFTGSLGEVGVVSSDDGTVEFVVGLGEKKRADADSFRRAGAALVDSAAAASVEFDLSASTDGVVDSGAAASAFTEGALLASYRFAAHKQNGKKSTLERVRIVGADQSAIESGLARAEAVTFAREQANTPAAELTPTRFAELAAARGAARGFSVTVYEEKAIAEMRLGGLLGVAKGSDEPPRLVRAEYVPDGDPPATVALVGKGITFDSGGLSIKPATGMMTMKYDCAGAATVLGVLGACRDLGVGVRVVGFTPLTENMPGGHATRPGDVLTIRNGKTIEVLNTDAEGRLVLADALSLAVEEQPDSIIDVATLTGAIVTAFGRKIGGLMGNDDRLLSQVEEAAGRAGEAMWRLPLPASYRSIVDSEFADMKNVGPVGEGGSIVAGLILEEFVSDTPWAHLDIAGVGWSEESSGYLRKGATGFAVRTLLELLEHYRPVGGKVAAEAPGRRLVR